MKLMYVKKLEPEWDKCKEQGMLYVSALNPNVWFKVILDEKGKVKKKVRSKALEELKEQFEGSVVEDE